MRLRSILNRHLRLQTWAALVAFASTIVTVSCLQRRTSAPDSNLQAIERQRTPRGMVYVPGGVCLLGSNDPDADDDVKPMRQEYVSSFYMDRTEVTNADFRKYNQDHDFSPSEANLPATNITYNEAAAYAKWAGKRLPTEAEWEKAARGADGRRYPWGNAWDAERVAKRAHRSMLSSISSAVKVKKAGQCALGTARVQPVGGVPTGISPFGCLDMAGNAWEWVEGYYNGDKSKRILRGGAVGYGERSMRTYGRAVEGSGDT